MAALLAAGFTLGIHFIDLRTDAADRSCVLPNALGSANAAGRASVDPRAFIAVLQMCRS
jgi:hypothetical protein